MIARRCSPAIWAPDSRWLRALGNVIPIASSSQAQVEPAEQIGVAGPRTSRSHCEGPSRGPTGDHGSLEEQVHRASSAAVSGRTPRWRCREAAVSAVVAAAVDDAADGAEALGAQHGSSSVLSASCTKARTAAHRGEHGPLSAR